LNKTNLRIAGLAAALALSAGCAKKKPADLPPPPVGADGTGWMEPPAAPAPEQVPVAASADRASGSAPTSCRA
jgi:hypothetical protein